MPPRANLPRLAAAWVLATAPTLAAPPMAAPASTPAVPAPTRAPAKQRANPDTVDLETAEPAALERWLAARRAAARAGAAELVRVPLAARSLGWGCECPEHFLGTSPDTAAGGAWIRPVAAPGAELPAAGRKGGVWVVEGRLSGEQVQEDLRDAAGQPPEWLYRLDVFEVARFRVSHGAEADARASVVADHATLAAAPPPLTDARHHLVIAGSFSQRSPRHEAQADALVARLRAGGFPDAERFDSARARNLFFGATVVVTGRHEDLAAAQAEAKRARAAGRSVYVKIGW